MSPPAELESITTVRSTQPTWLLHIQQSLCESRGRFNQAFFADWREWKPQARSPRFYPHEQVQTRTHALTVRFDRMNMPEFTEADGLRPCRRRQGCSTNLESFGYRPLHIPSSSQPLKDPNQACC